MKKFIVFILMSLFICNVFAQDRKYSFGLYIGPGLSWTGSDSKIIEKNGTKINYSFGALLDINIANNFAFSTGLTFNNYNINFKYPFGATGITYDDGPTIGDLPNNTELLYKLNYLSLPLGFKGKTSEIGYITYFLKAGVNPMVNLKAKANIGNDKNELIGKEINSFNFGWHIGGGIEITVAGNARILLEILYTGIVLDIDKTKVFTSADRLNTSNPKMLINDVSLKVGVLF